MARTQKNKATEYHLGLLKAKLARYRAQLLEPASKSGPAGVGFDVQKSSFFFPLRIEANSSLPSKVATRA